MRVFTEPHAVDVAGVEAAGPPWISGRAAIALAASITADVGEGSCRWSVEQDERISVGQRAASAACPARAIRIED